MMHLHTTKLHPAFLNAAERFIEKYLDEDIRIVKSDNEEEKFDHGIYNYNLLLDDLTSLKICKNINEEYFLTFSNPNHINCKQFIVLQFIKINLPHWSRRFKRGLNYIKELETIDSIVFQCLGELGIFEEKLSDEAINFIYEVKKILYGEKDDGNNLDLGKLGEKLSYRYEYMKTGIRPSFESLKNETSGYDIESFYKDGSSKRIEVKTSLHNRAFITWNEWKVAKRTIANNECYEFHFWQQDNGVWKLAVIEPKDLLFMGEENDDGHHWDKYLIFFSAFKIFFNEVSFN